MGLVASLEFDFAFGVEADVSDDVLGGFTTIDTLESFEVLLLD